MQSGIVTLIVILLIIFGGYWLIDNLKLGRSQVPAFTNNNITNPSSSYQYETTPIAKTKVYSRYSNPPQTTFPVPPNPGQDDQGGCYVGGCSSQICSDTPGVVSTCEYRAQYACYRTATCERQSNGTCGWTPTAELNYCLNNS